jgi:hypothetical protein
MNKVFNVNTESGANFSIRVNDHLFDPDYTVSVWMRPDRNVHKDILASYIVDDLSSTVILTENKFTIARQYRKWTILVVPAGGDDSVPQYELHFESIKDGVQIAYIVERSGSYFRLWESAIDRILTA